MKGILTLAAACCVALAIVGCSEKPAAPPATPPAKPSLGEPGKPEDVIPETDKRQAADPKPSGDSKASAEPAKTSAEPKESDTPTKEAPPPEDSATDKAPKSSDAGNATTGEKTAQIDDTINDVDEEE